MSDLFIFNRHFPSAVALFLLLASAPAHAQSTGPTRIALILGNTAYDERDHGDGTIRLNRLPNACADAQRVAAGLIKIGWNEDENFVQVCDKTTSEVYALLSTFVRKVRDNPGSIAFMYYSGHGIQVDDRSFIFGIDAAINIAAEKRTIDEGSERRMFVDSGLETFTDLFQRVGEVPEGGFTVLIDACRSDPLIVALGGGARKVTAPGQVAKEYEGQLIGLSTQNGDTASDGQGANGPYAEALFSNLRAGRPITNTLLKVSIDVRKHTARINPNKPQRPTYRGSSAIDCLIGCKDVETAPVLLPAPPRQGWLGPQGKARFMPASYMRRGDRRSLFSSGFEQSSPPPGVESASPQAQGTIYSAQGYEQISQLVGVRIDIFWCQGGPGEEQRRAAASNVAAALSEQARTTLGKILLVELRALSTTANARPSYRYLDNVIVADKSKLTAEVLPDVIRKTPFPLRPQNGTADRTITLYICAAPARSGPPARVFWQVPTSGSVERARTLQSQLDEIGGGFVSVRGIQTVPASPDSTEVRYYFEDDRVPAYRLADSLQTLLGKDVTIRFLGAMAANSTSGTLETWLGKSLAAKAQTPKWQANLPPDLFQSITRTAPSRNARVKAPLSSPGASVPNP